MGIRQAGSRLLNFLADNGYTRAYARGVQGPVFAVERVLARDPEMLRAAAGDLAARRIAAEVPNPLDYQGSSVQRSFAELTGIDNDFGQLFAPGAGYRQGLRNELVTASSELSPAKAKELIAWARQNQAARRPIGGVGAGAELLLANPAAAYGVPLAGAGLAALALGQLLGRDPTPEELAAVEKSAAISDIAR